MLGTPVQRLAADDGPAFLISDLHVPEDGGVAFDHLQRALHAARTAGARLFVLGDLFDSYVTPKQVRVGIWRDTAQAMAGAAGDGVAIDVLVGNRDFLLGPEFADRARVQLHHGGMRLRLGGVDTLLLHGDELCLNDLPYQRAKRWLRSSTVRFVARRLPLRMALRAAARARRRSRKVIAAGDQTRFLPTRAALEAAFEDGVERLVFGHIHRHATASVGDGRAFVLPAFDADGVGFRSAGGELVSVRFGPTGPEPVAAPTFDLLSLDLLASCY